MEHLLFANRIKDPPFPINVPVHVKFQEWKHSRPGLILKRGETYRFYWNHPSPKTIYDYRVIKAGDSGVTVFIDSTGEEWNVFKD